MKTQKSKNLVLGCHGMWSYVLQQTKKHQKSTKKNSKTMENGENMNFGQNRLFLPYDGGHGGY